MLMICIMKYLALGVINVLFKIEIFQSIMCTTGVYPGQSAGDPLLADPEQCTMAGCQPIGEQKAE